MSVCLFVCLSFIINKVDLQALVKRIPGVEEETGSRQPEAFRGKLDSSKGVLTKTKDQKRHAGSPHSTAMKRSRDDSSGTASKEILQLASKIKSLQSSVQDIAVSIITICSFRFLLYVVTPQVAQS